MRSELSKNIQDILNCLDNIIRINNIPPENTTAILEDFINYTHKNHIKGFQHNFTSEMLGWLKQYFINKDINIVLQRASQAKIWTNERLVKLGLMEEVSKKYYINGINIHRHTRDAFRHFVYYANKNWYNNCIKKEDIINHYEETQSE